MPAVDELGDAGHRSLPRRPRACAASPLKSWRVRSSASSSRASAREVLRRRWRRGRARARPRPSGPRPCRTWSARAPRAPPGTSASISRTIAAGAGRGARSNSPAVAFFSSRSSSCSSRIRFSSSSVRPEVAVTVIDCCWPGVHVARRDAHDAVGADVEGDLDLDLAAARRADAVEDELAEQLVLDGPLALALQHRDPDRGLVVLHGGEEVGLARRDGGVLRDDGLEVAAHHHDARGSAGVTSRSRTSSPFALRRGERVRLDGGAERDHLVRVDAAARLAPEEVLHRLLHARHAGHAADEDDLADLRRAARPRP